MTNYSKDRKVENNFRLTNNKADELTLKKLTKGNLTMTSKFDAILNKNV